MEIYRVARKQKLSEDDYKKVDERDLSNNSESWIVEKRIEIINISFKDAKERQSLIRIVFSEKDIIAFHEGLIKGWQKKLSGYKNLKAENDKLKEEIKSLRKSNT
jgi:hypothetical protein